jgi:hypothetical protein
MLRETMSPDRMAPLAAEQQRGHERLTRAFTRLQLRGGHPCAPLLSSYLECLDRDDGCDLFARESAG